MCTLYPIIRGRLVFLTALPIMDPCQTRHHVHERIPHRAALPFARMVPLRMTKNPPAILYHTQRRTPASGLHAKTTIFTLGPAQVSDSISLPFLPSAFAHCSPDVQPSRLHSPAKCLLRTLSSRFPALSFALSAFNRIHPRQHSPKESRLASFPHAR